MWRLAALLVLALVAGPLAIAPAKGVAIAAGLALAVCGLGLLLRSTAVFTAGVALALGEYAIALKVSGGAPRLGGAVVTGVAVAVLLEVADFDRRFRGVAFGDGVLRSQLRYWAGFAALGGAAAVALIVVAIAVNSAARLPWAPLIAALGALVAIGAATMALRRTIAPD